jgi:hypothetical protein
VGTRSFRERRAASSDRVALPIHRWVEDHALDLLEGPEPCSWRPETTNWVKELLTWAEQQAQAEQDRNRVVELLSLRNDTASAA